MSRIERILSIAEKAAMMAERRIRKELAALTRSGVISKAEARQLLKAAIREANAERKRVQAFIKAELTRELRKAKPLIKKVLAKKRQQFARYRTLRKR